MPAHAARRFRPVLTAALAVGVIGVSFAGIAVARSSSDDGEARLTATAPLDAPPVDASTGSSLDTELAADPLPTASPGTASPSPSRTTPTAKPTTARPTSTATKRPVRTKAPTKTTAPAPARTTQRPASGGSSSTVTEVIRLVNAERKAAGCGSLTGESRLHRAAQKHSERQASQDTMSHQLPGEASMGDRVAAEGYRWGGVAENVAAGYRTPADVMDGWMNSPGHKANILNCGYKHIGVGLAKSGKGTPYWTQNFASPL